VCVCVCVCVCACVCVCVCVCTLITLGTPHNPPPKDFLLICVCVHACVCACVHLRHSWYPPQPAASGFIGQGYIYVCVFLRVRLDVCVSVFFFFYGYSWYPQQLTTTGLEKHWHISINKIIFKKILHTCIKGNIWIFSSHTRTCTDSIAGSDVWLDHLHQRPIFLFFSLSHTHPHTQIATLDKTRGLLTIHDQFLNSFYPCHTHTHTHAHSHTRTGSSAGSNARLARLHKRQVSSRQPAARLLCHLRCRQVCCTCDVKRLIDTYNTTQYNSHIQTIPIHTCPMTYSLIGSALHISSAARRPHHLRCWQVCFMCDVK